mgnify:CR=1 FL=1
MNSIKSINVTHIASGDIWAGAESQLFELCKAMKSSDLDITLSAILFNDGALAKKLRKLEISVCVCSEERLSPLSMINKASRFLKKHNTDCIHTHGFKENIIGNLARLKAGCPRSVATVHGNPENNITWKQPVRKLTRLLDSSFTFLFQSKLIAVSGQLEDSLKIDFPNKTIVKIPNFVNFQSLQTYKNSAKKDTKKIKIGFIGRLIPLKRIDLFIQTIESIANNSTHPIEAAIIGDGPLKEEIDKIVKNKGLENVISIKGLVDPIYPEFAKLDILLMPSDHEGLPMTILEAMALGVAVVAHNVGGIPEALNNGQAGILVNDHTYQGYTSSITNLLNADSSIKILREYATQYISDNFDSSSAVTKYQSLYR